MAEGRQRGALQVRLLEREPDLGAGIEREALAQARLALVVPAVRIEPGAWDPREGSSHPRVSGEVLALLVCEGVLAGVTSLGERPATVLAGVGDVLPFPAAEDSSPLGASVHLAAAETGLVAILDERFLAASRRWPALAREVLRRMSLQLRRAAVHQAISQLPRSQDRLLALLWHLAERFGSVAPTGVTLNLRLTHETLGSLMGAGRPTVTLALRALEAEGLIERRLDGLLQLPHDSARALSSPLPSPPAIPTTAARRHSASPLAGGRRASEGRLDPRVLARRLALARENVALSGRRARMLCEESRRLCGRSGGAPAAG
jgi:CRP-like cAMP-binding protein